LAAKGTFNPAAKVIVPDVVPVVQVAAILHAQISRAESMESVRRSLNRYAEMGAIRAYRLNLQGSSFRPLMLPLDDYQIMLSNVDKLKKSQASMAKLATLGYPLYEGNEQCPQDFELAGYVTLDAIDAWLRRVTGNPFPFARSLRKTIADGQLRAFELVIGSTAYLQPINRPYLILYKDFEKMQAAVK
jgi:hypothetical protein